MKRHPALLATLMLVLVALACGGTGVDKQSGDNTNGGEASNSPESDGVDIESMQLARDDGAGDSGEVVTSFKTTDNPLHCVVKLSEAAPGTKVRVVWMALDAAGARDFEIAEPFEYTTGAEETEVDATVRLPREWPAGSYRVEAFANNQPPETLEFKIEQAEQEGVKRAKGKKGKG